MSEPNGVTRRGFLAGAAAAVASVPIAGRITPNQQIDFHQTQLRLHPKNTVALLSTSAQDIPIIELRRAYVRGQAIDVALRADDDAKITRATMSVYGTVDNVHNERFTLDLKLSSVDQDGGNFTVRFHFFNESIEHVQLIDNLIEIDYTDEASQLRTTQQKYKTVFGEQWTDGPRAISFTRVPRRFTLDISQDDGVVKVAFGWAVENPDNVIEQLPDGSIKSEPYIFALESIDVPLSSLTDLTVTSNVSREVETLLSSSLHTMTELSEVQLEVIVNELKTSRERNTPIQDPINVNIVRPGMVEVQRFTTKTDFETREPTEFEDVLVIEPATGHVEIYNEENTYIAAGTGERYLGNEPNLSIGVLQPQAYSEKVTAPFGLKINSGVYRGIDALGASVALVKNPNVSSVPQFVWLQPIMKSIADYACDAIPAVLARNEERRSDFLEVTDEFDASRRFLTPTELMILIGHTDDIQIEFSQNRIEGIDDYKNKRRFSVVGSEILRGKCDIPEDFDITRDIEVVIADKGWRELFSAVVPVRELEYPTVELGLPTPAFCNPIERIV